MREILFRGKRVDNGEWVYGFYFRAFCSDGNIKHFIQTVDVNGFFDIYIEVLPKTVGQYTGLTDKKCTKIFEGDIVKCKHTVPNAIESEDYSKIRYSYGGELREKTPNELVGFFGQHWEYVYWRNYTVEYYRGNLRLHNKSCVNDLSWSYIFGHDIEVIGNIHDNPELLEVGNG